MKSFVLRILMLVLASVLITWVLANVAGRKIEKFNTKLYQSISGKKPQHYQLDEDGVPYVAYQGNIGDQYNAVTIAEHALKWAKKEDSLSQFHFNACIDWLVKNNETLNDSSVIYYDHFDWPSYGMTSPWRSAMNQGRAMQAFLEKWEKSKDSTYLELANRSMNCLYTEVEDGGVTYKEGEGYWYEEYADDSSVESRVLNGMIVVIESLYDYYSRTDDPSAKYLLDMGISSLQQNIDNYNNNGHSYYDALGKPAKTWYHKFHIEQMDYMFRITGDTVFAYYRDLWKKYKEPSYLKQLREKPTNIGLFTTAIMFLAIFSVLLTGFLLVQKKRSI